MLSTSCQGVILVGSSITPASFRLLFSRSPDDPERENILLRFAPEAPSCRRSRQTSSKFQVTSHRIPGLIYYPLSFWCHTHTHKHTHTEMQMPAQYCPITFDLKRHVVSSTEPLALFPSPYPPVYATQVSYKVSLQLCISH